MGTWTYEGFWNAVLGAERDAAAVIEEFELDPTDHRGLDEWLGHAVAEAIGHGADFDDVTEFHTRALGELCAEAPEVKASSEGWAPTHEITFTDTRGKNTTWRVGLTDEGPAHTAQEWLDTDNAAWVLEGGEWFCEGQTSPGGASGEVTVRRI